MLKKNGVTIDTAGQAVLSPRTEHDRFLWRTFNSLHLDVTTSLMLLPQLPRHSLHNKRNNPLLTTRNWLTWTRCWSKPSVWLSGRVFIHFFENLCQSAFKLSWLLMVAVHLTSTLYVAFFSPFICSPAVRVIVVRWSLCADRGWPYNSHVCWTDSLADHT